MSGRHSAITSAKASLSTSIFRCRLAPVVDRGGDDIVALVEGHGRAIGGDRAHAQLRRNVVPGVVGADRRLQRGVRLVGQDIALARDAGGQKPDKADAAADFQNAGRRVSGASSATAARPSRRCPCRDRCGSRAVDPVPHPTRIPSSTISGAPTRRFQCRRTFRNGSDTGGPFDCGGSRPYRCWCNGEQAEAWRVLADGHRG
jgi:hypothetical protein